MLQPKSILSVEHIKRHSKPLYILNGAFVNFLRFLKLIYLFSAGKEIDFILLVARQFFT